MSTRTRLKSSTDFIRARGSRDVMAAHLPITNRYEVSGCLPRCFEKRHTFVVLPWGDMGVPQFSHSHGRASPAVLGHPQFLWTL